MRQDCVITEISSIRSALELIDSSGVGACVVTNKNKVVGILTDGDIRRFLLRKSDLDASVSEAMNSDFEYIYISSDDEAITNKICSNNKILPILMDDGSLFDIAIPGQKYNIPVLQPYLRGNELKYITECIKENWISSKGKYVLKFENMFEEMHGGYVAVSVSSGTTALHLALMALGVGIGDEVIVPNLTFAATANAVFMCGAVPVLCDVDDETFCLDVKKCRNLLTNKTKAIIPVHLYGQPADMNEIMSLANQHSILVIEDCAEALGSSIQSRLVGTFGHASTFSFFGNKTISTGEGGMVLFKNQSDAEKAKVLRDHGMSTEKRYWHDVIGYNYRMTNMQAAIGVAQLENFEKIIDQKLQIASWYNSLLDGVKEIIHKPVVYEQIANSNWLYTIIFNDTVSRDSVLNFLSRQGIETRPIFFPLSIMPPYKSCRKSNMDVSMAIFENGLSLPSSVDLTKNQVEHIVNKLILAIKN